MNEDKQAIGTLVAGDYDQRTIKITFTVEEWKKIKKIIGEKYIVCEEQ